MGGLAARSVARRRRLATRRRARLPIIALAVNGWRDAFRAIGKMPVPAGIVLLIMLVLAAGDLLLLQPPAQGQLAAQLVQLALNGK